MGKKEISVESHMAYSRMLKSMHTNTLHMMEVFSRVYPASNEINLAVKDLHDAVTSMKAKQSLYHINAAMGLAGGRPSAQSAR